MSNRQPAHGKGLRSTPSFTPVANRVLQRRCACGQHAGGGQCDECKKNEMLQRHPASSRATNAVPPIVNEVLRSPGQPLDRATCAFMEPRFGHDFSQVRVHTDAQAARSAGAVDAEAYTVANHVVFGSGLFQPHAPAGLQLLAHELTHVVQQASGSVGAPSRVAAIDPHPGMEAEARASAQTLGQKFPLRAPPTPGASLQRQPTGTSSTAKKTPAPHITEVRVNQNTSQSVKATFSDGSTAGDKCSTGKGHCCFDETSGTAEGGACSEARSNQVGNNCTPVGTSFKVTTKLPKNGDIEFWTQFHDAKSVALHAYSPVDGTPLSHGCVRLHRPMAKTIFDGAREGITRVIVEGESRPKCNYAPLQAEWEGDFRSAGTKPPDGQTVDPLLGRRLTPEEVGRERRHIQGARREMRSALDVNDPGLDAEVASWRGGASIVSKIPRCVPTLTTEEQKTPTAKASGFLTPGAAATAARFTAALNRTSSSADAEKVVRKFGEQAWQDSTAAARAGGAGTDDRQLYWTRLVLSNTLRQWDPMWRRTDADTMRRLHSRLLLLLEQTSRGITTAAFPATPDLKRILISGFDPFGFPGGGDIRQSNLSGAAALAFDGETLTAGAVSARIEAVVYPVRYADFDSGVIENFLRPHLTGPQPPHLVMSISQGGSQFELEEFAGRRRSTDAFQENLGLVSGGSPTNPVEAPGLASGPEFLRTNVPAPMLGAMRGAVGRKGAIPGETSVQYLPPKAAKAQTSAAGPPANPGKAVEGSGGGFLSNEIFYRNSLLRTQTGSTVPTIHLHTPTLAPGATDATRNTLIATIRNILQATLPHL